MRLMMGILVMMLLSFHMIAGIRQEAAGKNAQDAVGWKTKTGTLNVIADTSHLLATRNAGPESIVSHNPYHFTMTKHFWKGEKLITIAMTEFAKGSCQGSPVVIKKESQIDGDIEIRAMEGFDDPNIVYLYGNWSNYWGQDLYLEPGFGGHAGKFFNKSAGHGGDAERLERNIKFWRQASRRKNKVKLLKMMLQDYSSALKNMHNVDLLHRDINPDNLFVANPLEVSPDCIEHMSCRFLLGDLGLAKHLPKASVPRDGSPDYMPPEVLRGHKIIKEAIPDAVNAAVEAGTCGEGAPSDRHCVSAMELAEQNFQTRYPEYRWSKAGDVWALGAALLQGFAGAKFSEQSKRHERNAKRNFADMMPSMRAALKWKTKAKGSTIAGLVQYVPYEWSQLLLNMTDPDPSKRPTMQYVWKETDRLLGKERDDVPHVKWQRSYEIEWQRQVASPEDSLADKREKAKESSNYAWKDLKQALGGILPDELHRNCYNEYELAFSGQQGSAMMGTAL